MVQSLNLPVMTEAEITASVNFVRDFEVLRYVVGLATGIASALTGAIIFMYRDNRSERKEWRAEMVQQNERMISAITKNTEAFNKVELSNQRLADVVDRQEHTTQNLERLILEKLTG